MLYWSSRRRPHGRLCARPYSDSIDQTNVRSCLPVDVLLYQSPSFLLRSLRSNLVGQVHRRVSGSDPIVFYDRTPFSYWSIPLDHDSVHNRDMPNAARILSTFALAALLACSAVAQVRPPAVPLIAHDPYFSVWSTGDRLTDSATRHWTGKEQELTSLVRIDGKVYRLMGASPVMLPALPQTSLKVTPTRTIYTFDGGGATVQLTFTTPTLPDDIDVLSRPATYLTWNVKSNDGNRHDVAVYFDADAKLSVNVPEQKVVWGRERAGSLNALRIGSEEQPVLAKRGDDLRIDWGHLYVAGSGRGYVGGRASAVESFLRDGSLPRADERSTPRAAAEGIAAAFALPFGKVDSSPVSKHLIVAYDDLYSIQYFHRNLRPYWRRNGMDAKGLLQAADRDYSSLTVRCVAFDRELTQDLTAAGGADYATLGSL
ncbi:DUF5127 domain-containing protein, partial [bacterium]